MLRRWLTVLLAVLAALVAASPASASTHLGPQTRVGAFELAAHTLVGPARSPSPRNHRAKSRIMYNCASDPLLGVYDMRARWWSPRLGAFPSADQFGYFRANSTLWGWGDQNPAKWSDPSGNCPYCAIVIAGGAIGLGKGIAEVNWNDSAADIAGDLVYATAQGLSWGSGVGELLALGNALGQANGIVPQGGGSGQVVGGNPKAEAAAEAAEGATCGGGGLPDNAPVCRGGTCLAANWANGSGVTLDSQGRMQGASVSSAANASIEQLSSTYPNKQIGLSTVGDVRAAGGDVIASPTGNNPLHATLSGITPEQAQQLFTPTVPNPNRQ